MRISQLNERSRYNDNDTDWDMYDEDGNFLAQIAGEPSEESAIAHYNNHEYMNHESEELAAKAVAVTDYPKETVTNEAELPEPKFQLMKKSLLRAKWYLENEEMDPEMVSSELRDVNAMLGAVEDGIDEPLLSGLDTSIDEQYMSLYREAIAKLKGEETSIYGVDNDVLPPNAKPNPESPYNSGQVEENISLEDNSELRRIQELVKFR